MEATKYVVQRLVHDCDGGTWTGYSFEGDIGRELTQKFRDNPVDEKIAEKVLLKLTKIRTSESFRVVKRTTIVNDKIGLTVGPRHPLTIKDLSDLADRAGRRHDGVRVFNGLYDAIKEVGLDPDNFGAIPLSLVRYAIETVDNPKDEWIMVHPEHVGKAGHYEDWNSHREWWNLALRSKIKIESWGVGNDEQFWFERVAYDDPNKKSERYKTFAGAITESGNNLGTVSKAKLKIPKTKSM